MKFWFTNYDDKTGVDIKTSKITNILYVRTNKNNKRSEVSIFRSSSGELIIQTTHATRLKILPYASNSIRLEVE